MLRISSITWQERVPDLHGTVNSILLFLVKARNCNMIHNVCLQVGNILSLNYWSIENFDSQH